MALAELVGVDRDAVDEGVRRPLAADQDRDGLLGVEGHHAARAPQVQLANLSLEFGDGQRRLAREVRETAAIPRLDEKGDVVGPAEAICAQRSNTSAAQMKVPPAHLRRMPLRSKTAAIAAGGWTYA